jgi:hypothetical protein
MTAVSTANDPVDSAEGRVRRTIAPAAGEVAGRSEKGAGG